MRLFIDEQEITLEQFFMLLAAIEEAEETKLERMVESWRDSRSNTYEN